MMYKLVFKNINKVLADTCPMVGKTVDSRKCLYFNECGKEETHNGKWKEHWYRYKDGFICRHHFRKLIGNPKQSYEYWRKYNERQIVFLGKVFYLSWNIRKGFCSWCPNNIHDNSCLQTQMHHYFYVPIMVWCCTEEICVQCHTIESERLRKLNKK